MVAESGLVRTSEPDLRPVARDALRQHGVAEDAVLTLVNVSENVTYRVDDATTGERSALRLHRPGYHSLAEIRSELAWLEAVDRDGVVPVPRVLHAADGRAVVRATAGDRGRYAVRFSWVDGEEPAGDRLAEDFRVLGAVAACLHRHAAAWSRPSWFVRLRWDADGILGGVAPGHWGRWQDGVGVGTAEAAVLGRLEGELRRRLAAHGTGPDRFGLVHADMRLANVLVSGPARTVTLLDFDDCGLGWRLYDAAAAVSFFEHDPGVPALLNAWVGGYCEVASLSAQDVAEIPTFVLLRRLLLVAWLGSHPSADLAGELGADYTRDACDLAEDYLSGRGALSPGGLL